MFKELQKNGEKTPLDEVPDMDFSHNWFMNSYNILINSSYDGGRIPLSELKIYEKEFGVLGSFREFVSIIYAIGECYQKKRSEELDKKNNN